MFISHYQDLLRAIVNDNYDGIDSLCEQNLTIELAAKIYELEKHKGIQFRILNNTNDDEGASKKIKRGVSKAGKSNKIEFDVEILNHFYVGNMSIDRELNPSLRDYKLIQKQPNWIDYIEKGSMEDTERDSMDRKILDIFYQMKKYYQEGQALNNETGTKGEIDIVGVEERQKFEKSSYLMKETQKNFRVVMAHEYKLMQLYQSEKIFQNTGKQMDELIQASKDSQVEIDPVKLSQEGNEYLKKVSENYKSDFVPKEQLQIMSLEQYIQQEKEKSDMFLFAKIFTPDLYEKYIKIHKKEQIPTQSQDNLDQTEAQQAIQSLRNGSVGVETLKKKNLFQRLVAKIFSTTNSKKNEQQKLIEVFDVLIRSKQRLQLFHLQSGKDYMEIMGYLSKIQNYINDRSVIQQDESVYQFQIDPLQYDINNPEFIQTHCLRFEIDRSRGVNKTLGVKITDIDFYLGGNRHATAKTSEIYKQSQ
ncbi:UNKNOWN [Stylonychia lemnae]|uniref:Uncharacterized protein n=1 Tax=Stylonychia lemnae TaxID=5949 RepID=A0A078A9R7_STYLE|nr:UNKNOWN [Stylonychia lemnae]|eukprot:CDW77538.1 UNKNOWN [Stylonychia lemnae]